jgi:hypothetical protein
VSRTVRVYHADGCHLCESAIGAIQRVRSEIEPQPELELLDITGDPELERRYRARIPVVEIDGVEAFVYFVHPEVLRRKLMSPPAG